MSKALEMMLKELKLTTFVKNHASFAKQALNSDESFSNYLKALAQEELNQRINNKIKKLIYQAKFPNIKTLAEFDFSFIPNLNKQKILQISECHFIEEKYNLCFLGQTGTGKTHLATAIAYEACKKKYPVLFFSAAKLVNEYIVSRKAANLIKFQKRLTKAKLIVIDELGYIPFSKEGSEHLFQFFADCYEQLSVIITSNLEFSDWTKFMNDPTMTAALLDRFTHHCEIFTLNGESYRFKQRKTK